MDTTVENIINFPIPLSNDRGRSRSGVVSRGRNWAVKGTLENQIHGDFGHLSKAIELLEISPDDALRAVLSSYIPVDPGALRGAWAQRKNYGSPPTTLEIHAVFKKSNFKCGKCGSRYRLTVDHENGDAFDSSTKNLNPLCFDCNRSKRNNGNYIKGFKLKIFKAFMDLYEKNGRAPTQTEIKNHLSIKDLSGATYMVNLLTSIISRKTINQ